MTSLFPLPTNPNLLDPKMQSAEFPFNFKQESYTDLMAENYFGSQFPSEDIETPNMDAFTWASTFQAEPQQSVPKLVQPQFWQQPALYNQVTLASFAQTPAASQSAPSGQPSTEITYPFNTDFGNSSNGFSRAYSPSGSDDFSYHSGSESCSLAEISPVDAAQQHQTSFPSQPVASGSTTRDTSATRKQQDLRQHPNKRASSTASSHREVKITPLDDSEEIILPGLPEDFNQYSPGGELHRSGERLTMSAPDFSGKDDFWGVGEEAYSRLSLRAKKQLRNKVGARRFRERRKNYISTLEDHLAERDRIIESYRVQLLRSKMTIENMRTTDEPSFHKRREI